jgi:hypothetical protein
MYLNPYDRRKEAASTSPPIATFGEPTHGQIEAPSNLHSHLEHDLNAHGKPALL